MQYSVSRSVARVPPQLIPAGGCVRRGRSEPAFSPMACLVRDFVSDLSASVGSLLCTFSSVALAAASMDARCVLVLSVCKSCKNSCCVRCSLTVIPLDVRNIPHRLGQLRLAPKKHQCSLHEQNRINPAGLTTHQVVSATQSLPTLRVEAGHAPLSPRQDCSSVRSPWLRLVCHARAPHRTSRGLRLGQLGIREHDDGIFPRRQ